MVKITVSLFILFTLLGCVRQSVNMSEDSTLKPKEASILITDSKNVSIEFINGKKIRTFQQIWNSKWNAEVLLKPGEYEVEVKYWNGPTFKQHINSRYLFKVKTLPGKTYQIKHKELEKSAKLWIEDINISKQVGKVLASENEPITEIDNILDHSIYYKFAPPKNEDWLIAYRDKSQTALAKSGGKEDETYALNIILFDLPKIDSKEAFLDYVKTGREKDTDSDRFDIINEKIAPYKKFGDFCISYHTVAIDKKAKKRSKKKDSMILEMAGYVIRHPQNKNIGINFDYSHRYYKGDKDANLSVKASELFRRLEFY